MFKRKIKQTEKTWEKKILWVIEKMSASFSVLLDFQNYTTLKFFENEEGNSLLLLWYPIDLNGDDGEECLAWRKW